MLRSSYKNIQAIDWFKKDAFPMEVLDDDVAVGSRKYDSCKS